MEQNEFRVGADTVWRSLMHAKTNAQYRTSFAPIYAIVWGASAEATFMWIHSARRLVAATTSAILMSVHPSETSEETGWTQYSAVGYCA
jgi:uracil DNA glycosylase